jgi:imidazolonepropionase-like amidohydrolase
LTSLTLIDVFCEKGVFELADSRAILEAGAAAGLGINFHGDELSPICAAEMGAELKATAISHLEHVSHCNRDRAQHPRKEWDMHIRTMHVESRSRMI